MNNNWGKQEEERRGLIYVLDDCIYPDFTDRLITGIETNTDRSNNLHRSID